MYLATGEIQSRISDQDPDLIGVKPGVVPRKRRKTAAVKAWCAEYMKAEDVHREAARAWYDAQETLLQTPPTSLAGLVAYIDHVDGHCDPDKGWDDEWGNRAFPTLAAAVRTLIGGAQS